MAFDGVFAFQGKDHITASQLGRIVEGVAGKGRYVLPTLNQMTAEMQTANKVRVGTGDLVMDGRVVTNEAAVDLTVESGTSGYKRNDLVVCRYTKNASTGVENFAAEVVKGTPTTGTAADPKVTEGDISTGSASAVMPLWRIPLNGITPGAPVRIAPVASTLRTLGDSVSHGGEQPFAGGYLYRFGALYLLQIKNMTIKAGVVRTAGKLSVKPTREVVGAISYGSSAGYVSVHEDGTVYCTSRASGDFSGQVCFLAG